jgi:hypothetical protein
MTLFLVCGMFWVLALGLFIQGKAGAILTDFMI